jgi:ketosteroid isomerase-like protein
MLKILPFALVFVCLATPLFAQSEKESIAIEQSILEVMTNQAAAWNAGNLEGFMLGYWNSDQLVFVSGDKITRGWQATLNNYKKSYDSRAKMGTLTFTDLDVTVFSKDAASVLGSWSLAREKDNPKGKFTLLFRKVKGNWRIVHDHTS